jgi:hypothetical protein
MCRTHPAQGEKAPGRYVTLNPGISSSRIRVPDTLDSAPRPPWPDGAGDTAVRRFLEFFAATIHPQQEHPHAYYRTVTDFFAWLGAAGIGTLVDIEPLHVAPI